MSSNGRRSQASHDSMGATHKRRRRIVAAEIRNGAMPPCARCGLPIGPADTWHLDHADDRSGYLGPAHARCNLEAAGAKSAAMRAAARGAARPAPPGQGLWRWDGVAHRWGRVSRDWLGDAVEVR